MNTTPRQRTDLRGAVIGGVIGLVLGSAGMYAVNHRSPDQPGEGPCAAAAERFAQLDATWRVFTDTGGSPLTGGEPAALEQYRVAALDLLEQCRAAGK